MDDDKGKEKEPSETSKLEDSIEAFTKELKKLSIDDALECTEEMLEERERKAALHPFTWTFEISDLNVF